MDQEQWLNRRCFGGVDYPAAALANAKGAQGLTVSVCIPALNVAATVAPIVAAIRRAYVDQLRLVDELIVINGPSTDKTAELARRSGAIVVDERDVLPEAGSGSGKGEALWKSLAASSGDVVIWLDSDVHEFDPAIIPALLGPIISDPAIAFVKAHYRRMFGHLPTGGGRVTEICARPLLNLFFPELTVFVQPLAGEVAARRTLLEKIPFCEGYGVEVGMLIDVWRQVGLDGMAQVDLGSRRHDHQDLGALGAMASTITQVVLRRAGHELRAAHGSQFVTARPDGSGGVQLGKAAVHVTERPPMIDTATPADRS